MKDDSISISSSFIPQPSSFEYGDGRAVSSFILATGSPGLHRRMLAQLIADRAAKLSGGAAMDDAHGLLGLEQRTIEELVGLFERIVDALADEVQLGADLSCQVAGGSQVAGRRSLGG